MDLVSIILPVFNSEKYLIRSLEAVKAQTYNNFEVLLIDDGSTDNSPSICDQFALNDPRFKVVHQENKGICGARNTGLEIAKGTYIMFSDDDDLMAADAIEKAVKSIERGVDIVKFSVKYILLTDDNAEVSSEIQGVSRNMQIKSPDELLNIYDELRQSKTLIYLWNGIYRRKVIEEGAIRFDVTYKYGGEDFDFNCQYLMCSKSIMLIDNIIYTHYKRGNHSTAAKYNRNQVVALYQNKKTEEALLTRWILNTEERRNHDRLLYLVQLMSIFENPKCSERFIFVRSEIKRYVKDAGYLTWRKESNIFYEKYDRKTKVVAFFYRCRMVSAITVMIMLYRLRRRYLQ